ncbi:MAG TPA: hypothetical protein DD411_09075 [Alcanivorax sp.]|nr:hypothetical protein [Alcanivorax sp.]
MDRSGTGVAVAGIFPGGLFRLLLTAAQARVIAGAPGRTLRRHRLAERRGGRLFRFAGLRLGRRLFGGRCGLGGGLAFRLRYRLARFAVTRVVAGTADLIRCR